MPKQDDDLQRIEQAFVQARAELSQIGSRRLQIEQRIAASRMKPTRSTFAATAITCIAIFVIGLTLWWRSGAGDVSSDLSEASRLEIGDGEVVEHVSALIDGRAVVVVWSYGGKGMTMARKQGAEYRVGKYRCMTLHQHSLADRRTMVWSLFIPDEDVLPTLEPPMIRAESATSGLIAFSATPRATTSAELAAVIRSAGVREKSEDLVLEIQRQIQ